MDNTVLFFVILAGALVVAYYVSKNEPKGSSGDGAQHASETHPSHNPDTAHNATAARSASATPHNNTRGGSHSPTYCERMCGGKPTAVSKDGSYYEIHGDRCSDHVTKLVCKDPTTPFVPKIEQSCVANCGKDNGYLLPSCSGSDGRCASHDGVAPYPITLSGRCTSPCPRWKSQ